MANKKISELTAAGALDGSELVELVQGGVNKQSTTQDIANLGGGGISDGDKGEIVVSSSGTVWTIQNDATALVDASSMALTTNKHTLTTSSATRTFTISYTGDDITIEVTLNAVSSVFTFPATALCVVDGSETGDNTATLTGVSGDKHLIAIKKVGSNYYVVTHNFGQ